MEIQNEKKQQNSSLILKQDYIQFTNTNWKEAPTSHIYQHQLERGYTPLKHMHQPVERTPILNELQLIISPPFHPIYQQEPTYNLKTPIFLSITLPLYT